VGSGGAVPRRCEGRRVERSRSRLGACADRGVTAERLGLDAGPGRRIIVVAGPPVRVGERAVFFGPVVPDGVHPDDLPVAGQLHRVGDDRHLDAAPLPCVPDPRLGQDWLSGSYQSNREQARHSSG
jgi:hypothetical protein